MVDKFIKEWKIFNWEIIKNQEGFIKNVVDKRNEKYLIGKLSKVNEGL